MRAFRSWVRRNTLRGLALFVVTIYAIMIATVMLWFYLKEAYWEAMLDVWSSYAKGK